MNEGSRESFARAVLINVVANLIAAFIVYVAAALTGLVPWIGLLVLLFVAGIFILTASLVIHALASYGYAIEAGHTDRRGAKTLRSVHSFLYDLPESLFDALDRMRRRDDHGHDPAEPQL